MALKETVVSVALVVGGYRQQILPNEHESSINLFVNIEGLLHSHAFYYHIIIILG
jgi:hypothetical protein